MSTTLQLKLSPIVFFLVSKFRDLQMKFINGRTSKEICRREKIKRTHDRKKDNQTEKGRGMGEEEKKKE